MPSRSVLVIEDDPVLLRGLKDNFENAGYAVRAAADGQAGLDALLASPPDLVILDLMLPRLDGYTVCKRARERGHTMPIIMITAKGQEEDVVRGLEIGADDYVTKPFGVRELLARAKAFLRRLEQESPTVIAFGRHRLDLTARRLLRGSENVELTAKEFRLLEFFVTRSGRALTRSMILDQVWGAEVFVTERSVDRCVTTLRSKIERDPRAPEHIQTVRDIGYRFERGEMA